MCTMSAGRGELSAEPDKEFRYVPASLVKLVVEAAVPDSRFRFQIGDGTDFDFAQSGLL